MKKNVIKALDNMMYVLDVAITANKEFNGPVINMARFEIPYEKYITITDGVSCRMVRSKTDVLFEFEREAATYLTMFDYEKERVILTIAEQGAHFAPHYHTQIETLVCVRGKMVVKYKQNGSIFQKVLVPSSSIEISSGVVHSVTFLDDSCMVIASLVNQ
jgi:quercetin dioxygenase-like cupin family protein